MTIDFLQIRTYLYDWAIANIPNGMPAIYLNSNAPRPTVDYITLYIASVMQIGWDYTQDPTSDAGVANMIGDREFIFQVTAYGGDPISVLNNLRTSLQKETVLDSLRANGIVFVSWYDINDITQVIDSRYEQRAIMDIKFRIADIYTDTLGVIDTVHDVVGTYLSPTGATVQTDTFSIPPT
jgi:hypothetical protein